MPPNDVDVSRLADTTQNGNVVDLAAYKAQSAEQRKPTSPVSGQQRGLSVGVGVMLLFVFLFLILFGRR